MEHLEPGKRNPWLGTLVLDSLIWVLPKLYLTVQGEEFMDPRDLSILIWTRTSGFLESIFVKSIKYTLFHFMAPQASSTFYKKAWVNNSNNNYIYNIFILYYVCINHPVMSDFLQLHGL